MTTPPRSRLLRCAAPIVVAGLMLAGCAQEPPPDHAGRVTALADRYVADYLSAFPYMALVLGAPDSQPAALADHSLAALQRWQAAEDAMLAELTQIDPSTMAGTPAGLTYTFLKNQLESARDMRVCRMELWNVSPTWTGWQGEFPLVAGMQAVGTADDRRAAVTRWAQLPAWLDTEITNLRAGLAQGYTAPRSNVESVIRQMDALLSARVDDSPFVQMAAEPGPFRDQLIALETGGIRPAITRYRDFLKTDYLPRARTAIGVSTNPNGDACYRAAVKYHATVDMTAQQIHDTGLAEMRKLQDEVSQIGLRMFGTSDPVRVLSLARSERRYRFTSREELIAYAEAAVERARVALPNWFGRVPKAPVVVEPYPAFLEKTAPAGQAIPPGADGSPGKYMINAYNATAQSRAGLESTAFHEAYPGHHLQVALALEREGLHPIGRYFFLSGFGEGWALYTERLADEMGLFSGDIDRLGLLSNEALRAARLVVDSGMHMLGWTRQRAIDYLLANTTETPDRAAAEVDRYTAVPGQATSYMLGNLEIRRLRTSAQRALGDRFDIKAFHDAVLEEGSLPLWALRDKIERWVAAQQTTK
ncbi:MAG: DUF885 family protein [Vicinamibacterales bacterium]